MTIWTRANGSSFSIGIGDAPAPLVASASASQTSPRRCYVYGHRDVRGTLFYVGKGTKRRAWAGERHPLWHRYVEKHLGGKYEVVILHDDLSSEDAEALESEWMGQEAKTLVNWATMGRETDLEACERFHKLRNANRALFAAARNNEEQQPGEAIDRYYTALANLHEYATIQPERGLVGQLLTEERSEHGIGGDLTILDRLTLCLVRTGRGSEAARVADEYFAKYRADRTAAAAARITKRIAKATRFAS